jgi:predicted dinucleotide-binding enzyme
MTKIGILGSGEVGKALSKAFMGHGYQVVLGSDHVEKTAEFKKENPELETASFEQCARLADLTVLCVKGTEQYYCPGTCLTCVAHNGRRSEKKLSAFDL